MLEQNNVYVFLRIRSVAKNKPLSSDLHCNTTRKYLAAMWNPTCGRVPSPLVPAQSRLLRASCRLVLSTYKGGGYCSLPRHHSSVPLPPQQKGKCIKSTFLMFQHTFTASVHLWEEMDSIFSSPRVVAAYSRGALPEAISPQGWTSTALSSSLRISSHTVSWRPSTSPALVFHFLVRGSPKRGSVNKQRD